MEKSLGIKEFYSVFFFPDFIDHSGVEYMILSSHITDFYATEYISELARFLDIPTFRKSIQEPTSKGIPTARSIYDGGSVDGWNLYFDHF